MIYKELVRACMHWIVHLFMQLQHSGVCPLHSWVTRSNVGLNNFSDSQVRMCPLMCFLTSYTHQKPWTILENITKYVLVATYVSTAESVLFPYTRLTNKKTVCMTEKTNHVRQHLEVASLSNLKYLTKFLHCCRHVCLLICVPCSSVSPDILELQWGVCLYSETSKITWTVLRSFDNLFAAGETSKCDCKLSRSHGEPKCSHPRKTSKERTQPRQVCSTPCDVTSFNNRKTTFHVIELRKNIMFTTQWTETSTARGRVSCIPLTPSLWSAQFWGFLNCIVFKADIRKLFHKSLRVRKSRFRWSHTISNFDNMEVHNVTYWLRGVLATCFYFPWFRFQLWSLLTKYSSIIVLAYGRTSKEHYLWRCKGATADVVSRGIILRWWLSLYVQGLDRRNGLLDVFHSLNVLRRCPWCLSGESILHAMQPRI